MIKTTIKGLEEVKELEFPKLMKSTQGILLVLFTGQKEGIVLLGDDDWNLGHNSSSWNMGSFIDFNEELTLKNKQ